MSEMSVEYYENWQNKIKRGNLRDEIMDITNASTYDHRPFMDNRIAVEFPHMLWDDNLQYARFAAALAEVLKPATIYEVGIGYGITAKAFLAGYPDTKYFGIDNMCMGVHPDVALGGDSRLKYQIVDSRNLSTFVHPDGPIDLMHIDADHHMTMAIDDIVKGMHARPEWLLIDDAHNVSVATAAMIALYRTHVPELHMMYFENSHTGRLLIHAQRQYPQNRLLDFTGGD